MKGYIERRYIIIKREVKKINKNNMQEVLHISKIVEGFFFGLMKKQLGEHWPGLP